MRKGTLAALLTLCAARASAQEEPVVPEEPATPAEPEEEVPPPPSGEADVAARLDALEQRMGALEEENAALREEIALVEEDAEAAEELDRAADRGRFRLTGYADMGFFWAAGDGTGIRIDAGNRIFPQYDYVAGGWVFMGDPLATMVNARGEPAETGDSRAITYDPVGSGGASSFILNVLSVQLFAGLTDELTLTGVVDFAPRARDVSDPTGVFLGDFVHVKLAYLEWRPALDRVALSLFAGKFDSVLGIEYRRQDAPDRLTVSPSLLCRYTCGYPIGVKARLGLFDELLTLNVAVTNGSHFSEGFPFFDETDRNHVKTVAGRLSLRIDVALGLEIGVSGAVGAEDLQDDDGVLQWHFGADAMFEHNRLLLAAELVIGRADGRTDRSGDPADWIDCDLAACLEYKAAYGQVGVRVIEQLIPFVRADWRDALHRDGNSFVYVSRLVRLTTGLRLELGPHVVLKAEYTLVRELGRIPQFDDDVFTSSLSVRL
jgi:hypothetical protein